VLILVEVAEVTAAGVMLKRTALLLAIVWKFVPLMATGVGTGPLLGEKLVMVGAVDESTVKVPALLWLVPQVTRTDPVVAFDGTVTTICVAVADVTVAATPLIVTVGVVQPPARKSVPEIVSVEPGVPLFELISSAANVLDDEFVIERRFPTAS
jgi:hypothetical protein